jgi:hypothetical protein
MSSAIQATVVLSGNVTADGQSPQAIYALTATNRLGLRICRAINGSHEENACRERTAESKGMR